MLEYFKTPPASPLLCNCIRTFAVSNGMVQNSAQDAEKALAQSELTNGFTVVPRVDALVITVRVAFSRLARAHDGHAFAVRATRPPSTSTGPPVAATDRGDRPRRPTARRARSRARGGRARGGLGASGMCAVLGRMDRIRVSVWGMCVCADGRVQASRARGRSVGRSVVETSRRRDDATSRRVRGVATVVDVDASSRGRVILWCSRSRASVASVASVVSVASVASVAIDDGDSRSERVAKKKMSKKARRERGKKTQCEAAGRGDLDALRRSRERGCAWDARTCRFAAANGRIDCLRYAHKHRCPWDAATCHFAAANGHVDCLRYAHEHGCPWSFKTCRFAAANGRRIDCLRYALEHGCVSNSDYVHRCVLQCGDIDCMVRFARARGFLDEDEHERASRRLDDARERLVVGMAISFRNEGGSISEREFKPLYREYSEARRDFQTLLSNMFVRHR